MVRGAKEPKIDLSGSLKNKFTRGPRQTDKSAPLLFRVLCTENKLEVEKFALKGLIGHVTKFVENDEKSVISRRTAREPSAAHPAPVPRPRARSSQGGGGMWRDAPVGAGMTIVPRDLLA